MTRPMLLAATAAALGLVAAGPAYVQACGASPASWTFDREATGGPPAGFSFGRTGEGRPGRWVVQAEADAPSAPNVLAQLDAGRTSDRFPIGVANATSLRDMSLSVRCKPVSGRVDQACGLVFRYRDEDNYYLTRANARGNDIRLYYVKGGRQREIARWKGTVTANAWHELRVEARGDRLEVYWDGRRVIEKQDATLPDAGRVGIWAQADSVTYFDDVRVVPLEAGR